MPYWGASVRVDDFVVQAKVHGEDTQPAPEELIEYIRNLPKNNLQEKEYNIAEWFAKKLAKALIGTDYASWVTVDIIMNNGKLFGHTEVIEELASV